MREILFRGKRIDNGEWVYGNITQYHYDICSKDDIRYGEKDRYFMSSVEINDNAMVGFDGLEVIPQTVGQYTGLCDKNGTKIFEGDIVTGLFDFDFAINAVVEFRDGAFGLLANQHDVEHFHPFTSLCNIEYEVVGNIHDNPELLGNG